MSEISKQALKVENNSNFPDNNTGYITPSLLREFNTDLIDSTVNQSAYNAFTASVTSSIEQLSAFTASQQPTFTALNAFTASQLSINSGVNAFTFSADARLDVVESDITDLQTWSGSVNEIIVNGSSIGTSTRFFFAGFASASIVPNVNGAIAAITILPDGSKLFTSSFNAYTASEAATQTAFSTSVASTFTTNISKFNQYTASTNAWTASTQTSLDELLNFSASLSGGFATQGELDAVQTSLQTQIDTKTNTASFEAYTASNDTINTTQNSRLDQLSTFTASNANTSLNAYTASNDTKWNTIGSLTGSYATTGSNTFIGNQTVVGTSTFTGSILNNVFSASIVSSTASIDFSSASFYTLTLPSASTTFIDVKNVRAGQTSLLEITTVGAAATASFSTNVFQPSASFYVPSNVAGNDILTFSSFTNNKVYLVSVKQLING